MGKEPWLLLFEARPERAGMKGMRDDVSGAQGRRFLKKTRSPALKTMADVSGKRLIRRPEADVSPAVFSGPLRGGAVKGQDGTATGKPVFPEPAGVSPPLFPCRPSRFFAPVFSRGVFGVLPAVAVQACLPSASGRLRPAVRGTLRRRLGLRLPAAAFAGGSSCVCRSCLLFS